MTGGLRAGHPPFGKKRPYFTFLGEGVPRIRLLTYGFIKPVGRKFSETSYYRRFEADRQGGRCR